MTTNIEGTNRTTFMEFDVGAGLTVSVFPLPGHPVVSAQLWFTAGAVDEGVSQVGMAHLSEHFLFLNVDSRQGIVGDIQRHGGDVSALTAPDWTHVRTIFPGTDWLPGVRELLRILEPRHLDSGSVEDEKKVVLEEIRVSHSEPVRGVTQALLASLYGQHRYGKRVAGTVANVEAITCEKLSAFQGSHYGVRRCRLFLAGPIREGDLHELEQWAVNQNWNRGENRAVLPKPGEPCASLSRVALPGDLSLVALGFRLTELSPVERILMRRWIHALQVQVGRAANSAGTPGLMGGQFSLFEALQGDSVTLLGQVVPGEEERVLKQMGAWIERRVEEMKDGEWEQAQVASQTAFALRSEMIHPWLTQRALDWTLGMDPYRVEERYSLSDLHRCLERVFHPHAPSVVLSEAASQPGPFHFAPIPQKTSTEGVHEEPRPVGSSAASPRVIAGGPVPSLREMATPWGGTLIVECRPGTETSAVVLSWEHGIADELVPGTARLLSRLRGLSEAEMGDSRTTEAAWGLNEQGFCRLDSLGVQALNWSGQEETVLPGFFSRHLSGFRESESRLRQIWEGEVRFALGLHPTPTERALEEWKRQFFGDEHPYTRTGLPSAREFPWESGEALRHDAHLWFRPPTCVSIVTGKAVEAQRWIERAAGAHDWGTAPSARRTRTQWSSTGRSFDEPLHLGKGPRATVVVGGEGVSLGEPHWSSLQVWSAAMVSLTGPLSMTLRESLGAVYSLDGEVMGGLRGGAWWFVASCESNQAKAVAQSMSDTLRNASRHQRRLWMEGAGRLVRARFHIQQESCLARAMHHARVATVQGKLQSVGDESSAYLESPGEEFDEWLESVLSSGLCTVVLHHD